MAKVLLFPQKKRLPSSIEIRLHEIAKEYTEVLQALVILMNIDVSDNEQYNEVLEMIQEAFANGILAAVKEME